MNDRMFDLINQQQIAICEIGKELKLLKNKVKKMERTKCRK